MGGSARREPNAKHGRGRGRLRWWGRRIRMDAAVAITDAPLRLPRGVSHRRGPTALDLGCVVEAATWPRHPLLTGKAKCTSSDQVEDEKPPFSLKIPGRVPDCPNAVAPYRERVLARPCYRPVCLSSWSRRPGVGHAWQFRCSGSSCRSRAPRLPSLHAPSYPYAIGSSSEPFLFFSRCSAPPARRHVWPFRLPLQPRPAGRRTRRR